MNNSFDITIEKRRSIYALSNESTISDDRIKELVKHAIKHVPSSFNAQSSRAVILFDSNHKDLWDMTEAVLKEIVPKAQFGDTQTRINSFRSGYATILFFEDMAVIEGLQNQFSLYKDNFPIWSMQSSGMLQFAIWTSLAEEGMGASLQHYNELIKNGVKDKWHIPATWKLLAQMPIGKSTVEPDEKQFNDLDARLMVF